MNKTRTLLLPVGLITLLPLACGCTGGDDAPDAKATTAEWGTETSAGDSVTDAADEMSAAHILIMHKDSARVPPGITRSREEARALAEQIATEAHAEQADFAALAKEHSDGPSAADGGNLGVFTAAEMVKPFSDATRNLEVGRVSDPVETDFGYHIIKRQEVKKASAKHILVMYKGSMRAPAIITRTKEEALTRIEQCLERARAGEKFEDLAREYSDGPTASGGGDLGEFHHGVMTEAFDEAVFGGAVGKITDVVETPFGYHIIYRYK